MAKNKQDYVDELEAAGVELTGEETLPELKKLAATLPAESDEDEVEDADESEDSEDEEGSDEPDEDESDEPVDETEEKAPKGGFKVLDSNGKLVRTVKTIKEAEHLVKVYSGRIAR